MVTRKRTNHLMIFSKDFEYTDFHNRSRFLSVVKQMSDVQCLYGLLVMLLIEICTKQSFHFHIACPGQNRNNNVCNVNWAGLSPQYTHILMCKVRHFKRKQLFLKYLNYLKMDLTRCSYQDIAVTSEHLFFLIRLNESSVRQSERIKETLRKVDIITPIMIWHLFILTICMPL